MTEHPILYSTPMVQAKLAGRKTMTRRVVKSDKPIEDIIPVPRILELQDWWGSFRVTFDDGEDKIIKCPYGKVGNWLWTRETFYPEKYFNGLTENYFIRYKADFGPEPVGWSWKPSIFMPKERARIWEEIIGVHAERLGAIKMIDAIKEGIFYDDKFKGYISGDNPFCYHGSDPVVAFQKTLGVN